MISHYWVLYFSAVNKLGISGEPKNFVHVCFIQAVGGCFIRNISDELMLQQRAQAFLNLHNYIYIYSEHTVFIHSCFMLTPFHS